jgi:thioredoxin
MSLPKFVGSHAGQEAEAPASAAVVPQMLDAQGFDRLLAASKVPVVVDFWAEWCGPCHMMAPSVAQLAAEFGERAVVAKLNADESPEILDRYGIMGIPTLIYFSEGREVDRLIGAMPYRNIKAKLDRLVKQRVRGAE